MLASRSTIDAMMSTSYVVRLRRRALRWSTSARLSWNAASCWPTSVRAVAPGLSS
jgi:hypothetical protein